MNILVVNPANKPYTNLSILAEPLDVLNIATILKQNNKFVKVIDMDAQRINNDINDYLEEDNVVIFVIDYQLPLHTSYAMENIFETIKNTTKKSKFILIGKTPSYFYKKFLDNNVDIIIKGMCESIINDVVNNINNKDTLKTINGLIIKVDDSFIDTGMITKIFDYKDMQAPNRDLININNYMTTRTIITSRGCNNICKFCTTPFFFGKWTSRSVKSVVDEIEILVSNYNTKKIMFLDDNAIIDKNRMIQICNEIKKRNIKCLFGCLGSINYYSKELLTIMYDVGFRWIHYGIESGSEKILKEMNKPMNIDHVKRVVLETKELGFRVRTSFILDYPTSTKEDVIKTMNLINEIKPHELRLHYLSYRVSTPIYNDDIKNKTQYIHSNKPNIENEELTSSIDLLITNLKEQGYIIVNNEIDWNIYEEENKNIKIASFVPIKYGMCWYE